MMDQPSILVRILHSIPHVNISFRQVNDTFNPDSEVYLESLGILASIPAALLILSLLGLLLYLLTRCCDRKPRKSSSQRCQNCTLVTITLLCCAAIGLGLYGNDDFHNGLLQAFSSGRQVETLVANLKKQTESIKVDLETKIQMHNLEELIDKPNYNQTAVTILLDSCRLVRDNTSQAVRNLDMVLYFMKLDEKPIGPGTDSEFSLNNVLQSGELWESRRWPATLGFLTILLLLCTILVIGVARRSRCALIFFSVFGLFGIIICWFLAGIYLSSSVALGDFCMKPNEFMCRQIALKSPHDVYYLNCGTLRNSFILRLNESRDCVERARESVHIVSRMSREVYPRIDISNVVENMDKELEETKRKLSVLSAMLDRRSIDKHYAAAMKGICGGGLLGLSLMMIAGLLTAFLLTILVYADSHAWIYLTKKQPDVDKSETVPLFPTTPSATVSSPTIPHMSSTIGPTMSTSAPTSTINRTLLHHQQNHSATIGPTGHHRNGTAAGLRGLASYNSGDSSPPPGYDVVVHGSRSSGHHTLGRLPSQQSSLLSGPNNGSSTNQSSTLPKSSTAYPISKLTAESDKTDKDPRDVTNNGFNRFDPKYISIGPKAVRGNNNLNVLAAATANKCATLRHGGRYGGSLTSKGSTSSPNLKSAKTPSIATVSKDYCNQQDCSTLPYKKTTVNTFTDIPGTTGVGSSAAAIKKDLEAKQQSQQQQFQQQSQHHQYQQQQQQQQQIQQHHIQQQQHHHQQQQQLQQQQQHHHQQQQQQQQQHHHQQQQSQHHQPQQPSVYSIETSSYRSSSGKSSKGGGISILNQPLPEIPQPVIKEISKNIQQPLCVSNLNQYRSLQRPSKSQSGQHTSSSSNANYQLREVGRSASDGSTSVKVIPPSLPPKNRHKDDHQQSSRSSRQSNTQTLPGKSSSMSRHQSTTHSTFGYDRGQNMNPVEKSSKQFDNNKHSQSQSGSGSGIPYVEQYKSNLAASKQSYQTMTSSSSAGAAAAQHQRHSSNISSTTAHHYSSHQQNNNLPSYQTSQHQQSSHHHQQHTSSNSNKNVYDQHQQEL